MNEREALRQIAASLPGAGDDAAVVDGLVLTTDMLHERSDFPSGTTRYTAGWRAVGASLSDVAAMGAEATAAVAIYAAPDFDPDELDAFLKGARTVCRTVGAEYVGGDLDDHREFTVATTAVGETDAPVRRDGASAGEALCVTGTLGRTAAAIRLFEAGRTERANDLFRFPPRVDAGLALAPHATAMMDSSDGLARSLHQLAEAGDCGFAIDRSALPIADVVGEVADSPDDELEMGVFFGEDFELVFTVAEADVEAVRKASPVPITVIGEVTETIDGVRMDGEALPDRGYTHGGN